MKKAIIIALLSLFLVKCSSEAMVCGMWGTTDTSKHKSTVKPKRHK